MAQQLGNKFMPCSIIKRVAAHDATRIKEARKDVADRNKEELKRALRTYEVKNWGLPYCNGR